MITIERCIDLATIHEEAGFYETGALHDELIELRRHAAAWERLCAIDKERQATHRRPMLPRGVMDEVNRIALGRG